MVDQVETGAMRTALHRVQRDAGVSVTFAGLCGAEEDSGFRISALAGTRTSALRGLAIAPGNGLGGKAAAPARPASVTDYRASRGISHEYDAAVAAEDLCAVLAFPVVVRRRVRGVLYAALRQPSALGDRVKDATAEAVRELAETLAQRDRARSPARIGQPEAAHAPAPGTAAWEEVRAAHAELRALARRMTDDGARREVLGACDRLAKAWHPEVTAGRPGAGSALSPRETDVITWVAGGGTNAEIAAHAGLRPETVKAYLRSAMRKLGTHTRLETVVAARRAGLVP